MIDLAVDREAFKAGVESVCGIRRVHNYYGLVEQTGSIFLECAQGALHCSVFSDVIVRGEEFAPLGPGRRGLLQLASLLPLSYPGHLLLTEDEGELLGEDDCPCGRLGKRFRVFGRAQDAELRGCSDVHR
jgi:phenylacetate-coenzyme A ligase PaaK-like adenylate-forming protein